jgi:hypothetical protein
MSGQCRFSANSLLRAVKEAFDRPCRCEEAGTIPERALPRSGTFSGYSTCHSGTSARGFHVGFGTWAASSKGTMTFAICTADVLNSPRAPTASRTGELKRNERADRDGGNDAETRWGIQRCHRRAVAFSDGRCGAQPGSESVEKRTLTSFSVGGRGSHRAELRGLTFAGIAALP